MKGARRELATGEVPRQSETTTKRQTNAEDNARWSRPDVTLLPSNTYIQLHICIYLYAYICIHIYIYIYIYLYI